MQFCPNCKFMVYTKKINKDNEDECKNNLRYYCKNCLWEDDSENPIIKIDMQTPIYKRNYQDDYIADKIISNKYTIFDVTLPRKSLSCNNKKCLTYSQNFEKLKNDNKNIFLLKNVNADLEDEEITKILNDDNKDLDLNFHRIKLTNLIVFNNKNDENDKKEFLKKLNNEEFTNKLNEDDIVETYDLKDPNNSKTIEDILKKEVIYIKYDHINMRYLYICTKCSESWKKNI